MGDLEHTLRSDLFSPSAVTDRRYRRFHTENLEHRTRLKLNFTN